jgi:hypothetical protein
MALGQRFGLGDRDQQAGGQRLVENRLAEPCRGVRCTDDDRLDEVGEVEEGRQRGREGERGLADDAGEGVVDGLGALAVLVLSGEGLQAGEIGHHRAVGVRRGVVVGVALAHQKVLGAARGEVEPAVVIVPVVAHEGAA